VVSSMLQFSFMERFVKIAAQPANAGGAAGTAAARAPITNLPLEPGAR
jgi:hypothetical protein